MCGARSTTATLTGLRGLVLCAVAAVIVCGPTPQTAAGQEWASWAVYWENDSFAFWNGSDARYTNGVRFTLQDQVKWGLLEWLEGKGLTNFFLGDVAGEATNSVVIGQNFFTPNLITDFENNPIDRPFAGYSYGGFRLDFTESAPEINTSSRRSQHSIEVALGVLGQPSLAETFQKSIHILRESRIPKGWDHQLRTEPGVQLGYDYRTVLRGHLYKSADIDFTPHIGVGLGTVQTLAKGGGTVRIGTVPDFPSVLSIYSLDDPDPDRDMDRDGFQWALLAGYEFRGFAHNAFVDGGLLRGSTGLEENWAIHEFRYGIMLRKWGWGLNYSRVHHRTAEFVTPPELNVGDGSHRFGSLTISRMLGGTTRTDGDTNWWLRDWLFEISMGAGQSWEKAPRGDSEARSGASVRGGVSKGIFEKVMLGFELNGALHEQGPPNADDQHFDDFYVNKVVTLGWRPWGRDRLFIVRGGLGWGGVVKTQETIITDGREISREYTRDESRVGGLVGLSYGYPLGERASLGFDLSWGDLFERGVTAGAAASYLTWGIGLKWHP